ncbi:AraC-like DNA-binding protein/mannose-6-phosphate isomerase-like protein (cupin superfamily) [Pedobacter cryoconitis]|uniref:AraC-like DNA-binding protein/mannose-6-phosphate isomerase-like protein (Cupin superfamily) n=1 Tax=Pedobacter cryoconitis TaxID=188932 RepID=A0A7W9DX10_9SPHI|nr:helix-turn-helix transcriptional regulator [Pedobacter cryoconitis]MBB5634373.1 AraC-like DNA-binding protein/mannose-6-phosphate isomerase-like protein (cupin superfamily) [Pedobacter cryoconitis]
MPKNKNNIPVNSMTDGFSQGISVDRIRIKNADFITAQQYEEARSSHRDDGHTFHIVEKGALHIEIDFQKYEIEAPSVVYMHPSQVHRILDFQEITVCSLAIKNENLNPDYLKFLEEIAPAKPLKLTQETYLIFSDIFSLCLSFSIHKNHKLHFPLLKDSCNTLVAFLTLQFLNQSKPDVNLSRFEIVTKGFKQLLERNFHTLKRPYEYAGKLNISTAYLNECIKNTTGFSVTRNIHDRVILEAKRLLHHTGKSVKEIAFELGYEDYPYFSRTFTKATGMSALSFRNKNHD